MSNELQRLANDPNFVVQFAVGDPSSSLVPQSRRSGLHLSNVFFNEPKQYVLKSAHMSREDMRMFDVSTGRMVMVSHHPGKNPYEMLDPLGLTNQDMAYNVAGGEWESVCDVTAVSPYQSFKIRPKWMSRHGRQNIKVGDTVIMNVGKMGRLSTMSFRPHFMIGEGEDRDAVYKCVADMVGRSVSFHNDKDELVAVMAKSTKALLLTAAFGHGSESVIDIAPGVDCSVILAAVFGLQQVGEHFVADAFDNYVMQPATGAMIDSAIDAVGMGGAADEYTETSDSIFQATGLLTSTARFFYDSFFA